MISLRGFNTIAAAFSNRNYVIYTIGYAPSQIGIWMQRLAVGWLTWELTESATWLGIVAFADLVPLMVFGPLAGIVVDRFDRLSITRLMQSGMGVVAAILWLLTFTGLITIEILVVLVGFFGMCGAFFLPARQSLVPALVPRKDFPAALALTSTLWNTARFIGPVFAGLLIVNSGVAPVFFYNTFASAFFVVALWRLKPTPHTPTPSGGGLGRDLIAGYRYALSDAGIAPLLILVLAGGLFLRPVMELLPGFAEGVYGRGAAGLTWLTSAAGLGAMTAGLWLAQRGALTGLTSLTVSYLLVGAAAITAFSLIENFAVAVSAIAVMGFALVVNGTATLILIQSSLDRSMHGRVLSLYAMLLQGGTALGALVMGWFGSIFGLRTPPAVTAIFCLFVWAWLARRTRRMAQALETGRSDG